MDGGPDTQERPEHDVDYLRLTPLHRSWRPWKRKSDKGRGYVHTGAPSFRAGPNESNVVYVRRQRFHMPWWQRFMWGIVALALVVVVGGTAFVLSVRHRTTEVALADIVERFEATQDADVASDTQAVDEAPADATIGKTDAARPVTVDAAPEKQKDVAEARRIVLPPEGIYTFKTDGRESVSLFGASHEYPDETYATIRHLGGCKWQARLDIIEEHVDIVDFCTEDGRIEHTRQERQIEFFETREGEILDFRPPMVLFNGGEKDGSTTKLRATGNKGTTGDVKRTFVRREPVTVGKERVEALHIHIETVMTGRSRGTSDDQLWLRPSDGAILAYERHVDTYSKAFGADVHYIEDVRFDLVSLSPQR